MTVVRGAARRPGYTLLEILVATLIALLLVGALYVAFDLTLNQTDTGRGLVSESDFGRAVFNRMTLDLSFPVGPLPPKSGGGIDDQADTTTMPSASGTTGTTGTTSSGTTGTVVTAGSGATTDTAPADTASADAQSTIAANISFQAGVISTTPNQLTLFVSKLPSWLTDRSGMDTSALQQSGDLRRIIYYLHSSGKGLCRQERLWVLADGVRNSADPDRSTEGDDLIAPEVVAAVFEFADGSGWASQWNGSDADTDGTSVQGPPRAIRVTLTLELPDNSGRTTQKQIQHVFAVRAAKGLAEPPDPVDPATTPATGGM